MNGEWGMGYKNWKPPKCERRDLFVCLNSGSGVLVCLIFKESCLQTFLCTNWILYVQYCTRYYFPHKTYSMIPRFKILGVVGLMMCSFPRLTPWFRLLFDVNVCLIIFCVPFLPFSSLFFLTFNLGFSNPPPPIIPRPTTPRPHPRAQLMEKRMMMMMMIPKEQQQTEQLTNTEHKSNMKERPYSMCSGSIINYS